jgi:glycosyltransferase involved in cell wall biosynthesis
LIILDDGSTDNSWNLINQYSDPRIKAFRNKVNKGSIDGMNKAISEIATGEYIAVHHSDDVWELEKLEKQVAYLEAHSEIGAVFTWVQIIDEHGTKSTGDWFNQKNKTQWQWLNQLFLGQNNLNHPSVLIRKMCYRDVGVYRNGLAQTADAEMWSRVLIKFPIHVIQEELTKHRLFSDNSNTSGPRPEVAIRISNEWNVLRKNYLSITNFEEIVAIFPNLQRFRNPKGLDNKFLLAMACLFECEQQNARQLGLTWLLELIDDKTRFDKIRDLYSFCELDLIKFTAEFDVYYVERANRERLITELQAKVKDLQAHVHDLQTGNAWLSSQRDAWQKLSAELERSLDAIRAHRGMKLVNYLSRTKVF